MLLNVAELVTIWSGIGNFEAASLRLTSTLLVTCTPKGMTQARTPQKNSKSSRAEYIKKPPSSQRGLSFKTYQPCLGYALNDQFRWIRTLWCEAVSSLEILQCFFHLRFIVVVDHHQWLTLLHLRANLLDF